jgi:AraC-like DNA-binding protein
MASATEVDALTRCLSAHPLFRCADDVEETRVKVGEVFRPHHLSVRGMNRHLNAQMDHVQIGRLSINRLRYETGIDVRSEPMDSFMMLMMPIAGSAEIRYGSEAVRATAVNPALVSASQPLWMQWSPDCDQLIVRFDRAMVEQACAACLGYELSEPLQFELGMAMDTGGATCWHSVVTFLASNEAFMRGAVDFPLVAAQAEQLLLSALLHSHAHNYSEQMRRPVRALAPFFVRRAEEYMSANADHALTVQDVAAHVGVSVRSLHAGFQRYRGTTPMALLRDIRLERVRAELIAARNSGSRTTVADIALQWGFLHLGHFSRAYSEKFGEQPSQVLRVGSKTA